MVLDRETGEVRELPKTNQRAFLGYPGLSPDGSQVAFASAVGNDPTSLWALYVQDVATGEARELWRQTRSSKQ
jgi:Tol biopolymer transport system component